MQASLIVAAGGSSSRFRKSMAGVKPGSSKPEASKLFLPLAGKPVLIRSIEAFQKISQIKETVVTVPGGQEKFVSSLIREHGLKKVKVVRGGNSRAQSVWNGIRASGKNIPWIMVHDGARPLVTRKSIEQMLKASQGADGVLLARKVVPTIKEAGADGRILRTVDRSNLYEAETPQLVRRKVLETAYKQPDAFKFTDEASLAESVNAKVKVVVHDGWNPKITTVHDYKLAEHYLTGEGSVRTGFGRDIHKLVEGRKMILGGVHIPFEKGPLGHSDGDALLHAITDAILGGMGAGDIGEWFSDRDPKHKNISSSKILETIMKEASAKGFEMRHVDTVIVLEKPRLSPYKETIKKSIAKLLKLPLENVSVKAKTAEGFGPEGQGLAVSCEAMVTMRKI